ncbi:hypothetical protein AALP_AAs41566U000300 [Arabis alpina]|uniref:Uncharacterized protein n=1 Tax=Arabis alpina TaxID=50452 RepID=A0A087FWI3_ARAAL|nr:hypothetical protein AALP_AAs41566U000300 [Arabis alpina]
MRCGLLHLILDILFGDKVRSDSLDRQMSMVDELISHAVVRRSYPCCKCFS